MKEQYGVDSMPETGENVAEEFDVSREDQDAFAAAQPGQGAPPRRRTAGWRRRSCRSRSRSARAIRVVVDSDEHPRATPRSRRWPSCRTPFRKGGTVTAGNASGVNDGAAALIIASEAAAKRHGLTPLARILGGATAGVPPRIMGIGPAPASQKLLRAARPRTGADST